MPILVVVVNDGVVNDVELNDDDAGDVGVLYADQ